MAVRARPAMGSIDGRTRGRRRGTIGPSILGVARARVRVVHPPSRARSTTPVMGLGLGSVWRAAEIGCGSGGGGGRNEGIRQFLKIA